MTTTGAPTAALSETGALPTGVTFVDNGDGTATLAGTPRRAPPAPTALTITAANGVTPDATQTFTLTVARRPRRSPAPTSTTFTTGTAGHVHGDDHRDPDRDAERDRALPTGVTFVDNGDGTATLAGTPAAGTGGTTRSRSPPPTA